MCLSLFPSFQPMGFGNTQKDKFLRKVDVLCSGVFVGCPNGSSYSCFSGSPNVPLVVSVISTDGIRA